MSISPSPASDLRSSAPSPRFTGRGKVSAAHDRRSSNRATARTSKPPSSGRSREGKTLEIVGHGSKRGIGRAAQWDLSLDLSGLSGVTLYEPEELVLSARAGTPIAEIEALLAAHNQELAFEPIDYGPLSAPQRAAARSAACSPRTSRARAASRRARRATISSASRRCRAGRDLQVGRARGEERHRLRPLQAAGRLLGHARRDDRRDRQGAAARRNRGDRAGARARRCRAPRAR